MWPARAANARTSAAAGHSTTSMLSLRAGGQAVRRCCRVAWRPVSAAAAYACFSLYIARATQAAQRLIDSAEADCRQVLVRKTAPPSLRSPWKRQWSGKKDNFYVG
eukprot:17538-Heterococcus_DN1.PRE.1